MFKDSPTSQTIIDRLANFFVMDPLQVPVCKISAAEFEAAEKNGFLPLQNQLRRGVIKIARSNAPSFILLTHDLMVAITSRTLELVIPMKRYQALSSATITAISSIRRIAILDSIPRSKERLDFMWPEFRHPNTIGYLGQNLSQFKRHTQAFILVSEAFFSDLCQRGEITLIPTPKRVLRSKHIHQELNRMRWDYEHSRFSSGYLHSLLNQGNPTIKDSTLVLPTTELSFTGATGDDFGDLFDLVDNQVHRVSMDRGLAYKTWKGQTFGTYGFLGPRTVLTYDHATGEINGESLAYVIREALLHRLIQRAQGQLQTHKFVLEGRKILIKEVDLLDLSPEHFMPHPNKVFRIGTKGDAEDMGVIVPGPLFRLLCEKADAFSLEIEYTDSLWSDVPDGKLLTNPLYWETLLERQTKIEADEEADEENETAYENSVKNLAFPETDTSLRN